MYLFAEWDDRFVRGANLAYSHVSRFVCCNMALFHPIVMIKDACQQRYMQAPTVTRKFWHEHHRLPMRSKVGRLTFAISPHAEPEELVQLNRELSGFPLLVPACDPRVCQCSIASIKQSQS